MKAMQSAKIWLEMGFVLCLVSVLNAQTPTTAPTVGDPPAPAWGAKDQAKWPASVMYNEGILEGNRGIGGSGFLFRLPNSAVVAGTVLHVFGESTKLQDLQPMIKTWAMVAPVTHKKVLLKTLVMNIDPDKPVDCVIANVPSSSSYPVEVLTPRVTPVTTGEVVYVPGPNQGEGKVSYHKAVVSKVEDTQITYVYDPVVETNGFSGAPILDAHGLLVGIHQGHLSTSDGSKAWYGFPIGAAIAVTNSKAPAVANAKPAAAAGTPAAAGSSSDAAAKANNALDMAQNYITLGKYDMAKTKLQDIITTYPGTPAAKKAKATLDAIADK